MIRKRSKRVIKKVCYFKITPEQALQMPDLFPNPILCVSALGVNAFNPSGPYVLETQRLITGNEIYAYDNSLPISFSIWLRMSLEQNGFDLSMLHPDNVAFSISFFGHIKKCIKDYELSFANKKFMMILLEDVE